MSVRTILGALAALCVAGLPAAITTASAAIPSAEEAPAANLAAGILAEMAATQGDEDAIMAAITRATRGADLRVIVEALRLLRAGQLGEVYGSDATAIAQAQATLTRPEVQAALSEASEIAQLALASYGATGGVPAGGAPGQAFGSSGIGAPGGGGGSGYTN